MFGLGALCLDKVKRRVLLYHCIFISLDLVIAGIYTIFYQKEFGYSVNLLENIRVPFKN
ncbi:protein of unknown function [Candidatus Nitrotoga arctica]|uniref:Uncharacterized protein n=1 Tax=Candidatus Nitrotoga arctica TaxID=453162 RepID=A0ABN8AUS0_9PROT|nr:protein of unknown function [Candidatus Nitrotoga arctica]